MPKLPVKSVTVRFRAYPKELAAWKRFAREDSQTLSTWLRDMANARLDERPVRSTGLASGSARWR